MGHDELIQEPSKNKIFVFKAEVGQNQQIYKSKLNVFFIIDKMKSLESHTKLIEIQSRLNKQSYLSRGNLPGSADAKMFLFLQSIKRYPERKSYPNFYHWYILMKQFATSSIEKWISNNEHLDDDQLITDFIAFKQSQKILPDSQLFKKNNNTNESITDDHGKSIKPQDNANPVCHEIEYIMDVKIKEGIECNMRELVTNFLAQEQIEAPDVQELMEERRVRIVAKMDPEKYQQLKNKISALEGVQTFESKKKDKRFKTVNSVTNFLGDA